VNKQDSDLTGEIDAALQRVGELIKEIGTAAIERIHDAEHIAIQRIEEYVPQERLLTLKEAAAYLHYRPRTIDGYTTSGKEPLICFTMIGGKKRFKKRWLEEAIERGAVKPRGITRL
jgi:hypothetical protein